MGAVDVDGINDLIETGITFGLLPLNQTLEKGAPLPELPLFKLVNPNIFYREFYAVFSTDVY